MIKNNSILEIRKEKFIENPNHDNYKKLAEKIDKNKEIFDNLFFTKAVNIFIRNKDSKGLLFISQLYIKLKRNVEAEYILFGAHKIDETNEEILYYLFDILCRRKQLELVSIIGEKLNKMQNEVMYVKSLIKYCILTKKTFEFDDLLKTYFEKYKDDKEFISLVFIAANHNNSHYGTYLISKTKAQQEIFDSLTGHIKYRTKNHFIHMIIHILREMINETKNS